MSVTAPSTPLTGHGDPIMVPADATEMLQYEGEVVVVIGKECRNVTEEQALDYVLGYTIGNDVSERTWQRKRPHHVARQKHRHLQADGTLDRHRRGS